MISRAIWISTASALLLSACGDKWEREISAISPDGSLQAVVEYKGSAACCSDHSRLRLLERAKGTLAEEPEVVVEAANAHLKSHWESNDQLIVEACGATSYEVTSRVFRNGVLRSDGSEDAIRIDVVSLPDTERNEKSYCASASH